MDKSACAKSISHKVKSSKSDRNNHSIKVKVKANEGVLIPQYKYKSDAGMDLCSNEDEVILYPGERAVIKTGIHVEIPDGYAFEVSPRSGISANTNLLVVLGTIDAQYRGDIGVIVVNMSQASLTEVTGEVDSSKDYVVLNEDEDSPMYMEIRGLDDKDPNFHGAYVIRKGDRLAQLKLKVTPCCEWEVVDELSESERGNNGFGSTGISLEDGDLIEE